MIPCPGTARVLSLSLPPLPHAPKCASSTDCPLSCPQLYELDEDPKRKEFLDDLFGFMQKRGKGGWLGWAPLAPLPRLPGGDSFYGPLGL